MGRSSGGDIFDPVCELLVKLTEASTGIYATDTKEVLSTLIKQLQMNDWDTEDESLTNFQQYRYVVDAFAENKVYVYEEDPERLMELAELEKEGPGHGEWK